MSPAYLLLDVVICIAGLFAIGYPLTRLSRSIEGSERLPWALVLGICTMIVYVRTVNSVTAIDRAAPFIAVTIVAWLVYHWRKRTLRELLMGDLRAVNPIMSICWFVALILIVVALNFPVFEHHALVFEYSPNHDAIYYITNARWMLGHSFSEAVTYSADKPLFYISTSFFGKAPPLGRVGAEGLLAFVSAITKQDPLLHFQAMEAVALVAGVAISALLLPRQVSSLLARPTFAGLLMITSVVFAPALIQIPINSSFSNAYGIVIMTAFVLTSLRGPARRLDVLQPLLFAGLLATYPELAPISLVIIGAVLLFEFAFRSQSFHEVFARGTRALLAAVATVFIFPWISTFALMVLKTVYFAASTQGASWPNPYAGLGPLQLLAAALTTSRSFASMLPSALIIAAGLLLCVTFFRTIRRSRDSALFCGVALALTVFLGYIFYKEFNYGKLKILEYFSLFFTPSLIIGCGFARERVSRDKLGQTLPYLALLTVSGINVGACYFLLTQGIHTAENKYIADDFIDAIAAADNDPHHSYLAVKFTTEPFFYSMWTSYFSHQPVVFSKTFGSGGYLQSFTDTHPATAYDAAPTTIADDGAFSSSAFGAKVLGRYDRFFLIDQRDASQLLVKGLYANEGAWSWMGRQLVLNISGEKAHFVNLALSNRYDPVTNLEKVSITIDGKKCEFLASAISNELSIALPEGVTHQLKITPSDRAVSPSMLSQSSDSRILTYQVSGLALSTDASYHPVTCSGTP